MIPEVLRVLDNPTKKNQLRQHILSENMVKWLIYKHPVQYTLKYVEDADELEHHLEILLYRGETTLSNIIHDSDLSII